VLVIRTASAADAQAVARIRSASWRAAYVGLISDELLQRITAPDGGARERRAFASWPWRTVILAEPGPGGGARDDDPAVPEAGLAEAGLSAAGFAAFGPQRDADGLHGSMPGAAMPGREGRPAAAELYAIYVLPSLWSSGVGRALLTEVVDRARQAGYRSLSLWVLDGNARARRFYERAGFAATGERAVLADLGGVTEVRYLLPLGVRRPRGRPRLAW
jgi:ribosomal protein S18 acetylase RimI-like enzyme